MQSETPGARGPLSYNANTRLACSLGQNGRQSPKIIVLGATCQIQGTHPSPRWTPAAKAAVPGGWIYLTREGFVYAISIPSFSIMAQSLVN
jgi:hypothetical protein